jgi:hypothetical protein
MNQANVGGDGVDREMQVRRGERWMRCLVRFRRFGVEALAATEENAIGSCPTRSVVVSWKQNVRESYSGGNAERRVRNGSS